MQANTAPTKGISANNLASRGWTIAPWESKGGCPYALIFESEKGDFIWLHCNKGVNIQND